MQSLGSELKKKKTLLNSQLNLGLKVAGHPKAIFKKKKEEEMVSNPSLQAQGLKITLPLSAIDDCP